MANRADNAVLALDIGTSSCRASLYDLQGQPIPEHAAHVTYSPRVTPDGGAELEPEALLNHVAETIDRVLAVPNGPRVLAVGTSTFWHSLLGVDASGRPITPLYLWLDARARGEVAGLRQRFDERAVHARTGCVLHWTYWPARLTWLRRADLETFARVKRWLSFGEFLLERLTGQIGASVSMAAGTGLLDVHTCEWDAQLVDALELNPAQLNPLTSIPGTTRSGRWPRLKQVPWLAAIGDGACSNVGADCAVPDRFALMIGTSGAERVVWAPTSQFEIPWGLWCYRVDRRRIVVGGALNDGGSLFDWLRRTLHLPGTENAESAIAAMQPDNHGLTVLPLWGGERNPNWADDARGAIVGMNFSTRSEEILRACLEGVALRFRQIDRLLTAAVPNAKEVVATGGALLHSPTWMQIIADTLGRSVLASAESEASSRGATLLALDALDLLASPIETNEPEVTRRFEPIAEHTERYAAAAQRQQRLYDSLVV